MTTSQRQPRSITVGCFVPSQINRVVGDMRLQCQHMYVAALRTSFVKGGNSYRVCCDYGMHGHDSLSSGAHDSMSCRGAVACHLVLT
jgi:hypothetical protein